MSNIAIDRKAMRVMNLWGSTSIQIIGISKGSWKGHRSLTLGRFAGDQVTWWRGFSPVGICHLGRFFQVGLVVPIQAAGPHGPMMLNIRSTAAEASTLQLLAQVLLTRASMSLDNERHAHASLRAGRPAVNQKARDAMQLALPVREVKMSRI